jgi:hypothetical protein
VSAAVIALPQGLSHASTGVITYWRLSGTADHGMLAREWVNASASLSEAVARGLAPQAPSPIVALRRTAEDLADKTHCLVRPLHGRDGFALVEELYHPSNNGRPTHRVVRDLWLERTKDQSIHVAHTGARHALRIDGEWEPAQSNEAFKLYDWYVCTMATQELGSWLVSLVQACHAVSLRDSGGIYYVPAATAPLWDHYTRVVREHTQCTVFGIPALDAAGAADAVLDALQREGTAVLDEVSKNLYEVDTTGKRAVGKRALNGRARRLEELERKIEAYADMLGGRLNQLHERAGSIGAKVGELLLLGEGE